MKEHISRFVFVRNLLLTLEKKIESEQTIKENCILTGLQVNLAFF